MIQLSSEDIIRTGYGIAGVEQNTKISQSQSGITD